MTIKPPVHRPPGIGDRKQRPHPRSAEAEAYRRLYRDPRWCGPHGVRQQSLLRDLYTCQRCNCLLVSGNRHHPRAAVVNHKKPHKGDEVLFFDLDNTEAVCKSCHDALIQKEEARGYTIGSDINGRPVDPQHPWNRT
jgi:5-methylcytosine-specific restriction endonuclease McrA